LMPLAIKLQTQQDRSAVASLTAVPVGNVIEHDSARARVPSALASAEHVARVECNTFRAHFHSNWAGCTAHTHVVKVAHSTARLGICAGVVVLAHVVGGPVAVTPDARHAVLITRLVATRCADSVQGGEMYLQLQERYD
jgi:hypothetical protein